VRLKPTSADDVLEDIVSLVSRRFAGLSGIVYCYSKKEAEQVAGALKDGGINADFYHADMEFTGTMGRMQVYEDWIRGRIQVVVATIAFGMGINKEDVRFVIHHTISKGPSAYYQVNVGPFSGANIQGFPATGIMNSLLCFEETRRRCKQHHVFNLTFKESYGGLVRTSCHLVLENA
jgi:ATP-dependent DNA helicase Q1